MTTGNEVLCYQRTEIAIYPFLLNIQQQEMFYAEIVEQTLPQPLQAPFHAAVCDIVYSDVMTVKEKKCIGMCWIVIKI